MKRYLKNLLLSLLAPAMMTAAAAAAAFPVPATDASGVTRWGYMGDDGSKVTDFIYASAEEFGENGLAVVTNTDGRMALICEDGALATDWLKMPKSIRTDGYWQVLDYGRHMDYYDGSGVLVASIDGAEGFPGDGLVVTAAGTGRSERYGYSALQPGELEEEEAPQEEAGSDGQPPETLPDGGSLVDTEQDSAGDSGSETGPEAFEEEAGPDGFAISPQYLAAGAFREGRALVQTEHGVYAVIDTRGRVLCELPEGTSPVALDIYADDVVILEMQGKYALYSLDSMQFITSFSYDEILPFDRAAARCRVGNLWGLITSGGSVVIEPSYPYLSYMGEGVYAARGTDPGAAAVSESGKVLYSTGTYVGGFQTFTHGLSWHGKLDGSVVFFNAIGTIAQPLTGVENPQVLTSRVARVTRDGVDCYINIRTGEMIYTNDRSYMLENGLQIAAETYEKYLGMREDGMEYGYHIEYPQISGHSDAAVQTLINDTIRSFFVTGPSGAQDRSLEVTFGFSVEGQVLVVWANGVSGLDSSAVIWNDSIGLDLTTGARYTAYDSLFHGSAGTVLSRLLPKDASYYSYPRMDANGVTFFCNYPSERGSAPYAKSVHLTFRQLAEAIDTSSACYQALTAPQQG